MTKQKTVTFYVWLFNSTDPRDDEPVKVKAKTKAEALIMALSKDSWRWSHGEPFTKTEFFKLHPDWKGLI